jgi:hypothetical protein
MSQDVDKTELITKKVTDLLNVVLDSEHTQDFGHALKTEKTWLQTADGRHLFGLAADGVTRYTELIDYVLGMKQWDRLSLKYVKNQMNELLEKSLTDVVKDADSGTLPTAVRDADIGDVRERVRSFVVDLDREASEEWIVCLPLSGIAGISGNSLKIGRACLRYMNSVEMDTLRATIGSIPNEFVRGRIETLKETVCAIYHITGESDGAKEIAEEQTQDVLDLLSYFVSFMHSRDYKGAVRLQGEMAAGHRTTLLLSPGNGRWHLAAERTGMYMPVEFTRNDVKAMKRLGIFDLSAIIERGRPTKFQQTVLAGIRWFAASQRQETPEIEFVNLVTCLENCLAPGDGTPIGSSIAEACSILLKDELEQRLSLRSTVLQIYKVRSKIVHGASLTSKLETSLLDQLRVITRRLLAVLIERIDEFKDKEALLTWIQRQKLTPK